MRPFFTPQRLSSNQAAEFLGIAPRTLIMWRYADRYPLPYTKVGRKVVYDLSDLLAFMESRKVG